MLFVASVNDDSWCRCSDNEVNAHRFTIPTQPQVRLPIIVIQIVSRLPVSQSARTEECTSCLRNFSTRYAAQRHICHFEDNTVLDDSTIILHPCLRKTETKRLIKTEMCNSDIVAMCQLQNCCNEVVWPLTFPGCGHGIEAMRLSLGN